MVKNPAPVTLHYFKNLRALVVLCFCFLFSNCSQENDQIIRIKGEAQGTTYQISYLSSGKVNYKRDIDSLLQTIDLSLSTYVPHSLISGINRNDNVVADKYFTEVFNKAQQVSEKTEGDFDVTVAPVINAWGFGFTKKAQVDSVMIDSLLQFIGYKMVSLQNGKVVKAKPQIMLDFNAIAQGYTVDQLASFLESKGISDYLVELGGEVKARGMKNKNVYWKIGIDEPNESFNDERPLKAIVSLRNKGLATSGNYRKYYVENGRKYAHIIDPHTGYPAKHNLLSVTVIAGNCMTADAYATAFMVMGLDRAKSFLSENQDLGLEVFFIYDDQGSWKTYMSETLVEWTEVISDNN